MLTLLRSLVQQMTNQKAWFPLQLAWMEMGELDVNVLCIVDTIGGH